LCGHSKKKKKKIEGTIVDIVNCSLYFTLFSSAFITQTICGGGEGKLIGSWVVHDGHHGLHGQKTDSCSGFEGICSCSFSSVGFVTDSNYETMNGDLPLVQVHVRDSCSG
jgi:hypothetical protein